MPSSTFAIFAEQDGWRIGVAARSGEVSIIDVPVAPDAAEDVRASALSQALRASGCRDDQPVALALASRDCLCASIDASDLPARQRAQAMLYRFEEKLPVSAEEIAADFIAGDASSGRARLLPSRRHEPFGTRTGFEREPAMRDGSADFGELDSTELIEVSRAGASPSCVLAVGVEKRVLEPLVGSIEAAGARVAAICPASLLALQHWLDLREPTSGDATSAEMMLWGCGPDGADAELFVLIDGRLRGWYVLPQEFSDIALHVRMALLGDRREWRLTACGLRAEILSRMEELGVPVTRADSISIPQSATAAARLVLRGSREPWIDLADASTRTVRGAVRAAGAATRWATAAGFVLAACLAVGMFGRAMRYDRLAARYDAEQHELFRAVLPGQPIPRDVRSRLASEAQQGTRGNITVSAQAGEQLLVLRDLIGFLPTDVRFRVFELRVDEGQFVLEGEVQSHGEAEGVAAALRRRPGFDVEAPRTEQRPGRAIGFTITGALTAATDDFAQIERRAAR